MCSCLHVLCNHTLRTPQPGPEFLSEVSSLAYNIDLLIEVLMQKICNEKCDVCMSSNSLGDERPDPSTSLSLPSPSSVPATSSSAPTSDLPFVSDALVGEAEARRHSTHAYILCATIEKSGNHCLLCKLVKWRFLEHAVTDILPASQTKMFTVLEPRSRD